MTAPWDIKMGLSLVTKYISGPGRRIALGKSPELDILRDSNIQKQERFSSSFP